MQVDVWSDVVCPWCFIGKRRLESALAAFPGRDDVQVVFHAFELDPNAPRQSDRSLDEMLASKYGLDRKKVAEMQARVTSLAAAEGLSFRLDAARPENTFDAHRLVALAKRHGRHLEVEDALFRAYFEQGKRVGDPAVLREVGLTNGLPADAVDALLADPAAFADEVRADQAQARQIGVRGVPFYVIDGKYGVSGAQPADVLRSALERAWSERPAPAEGCDDGACAVPDTQS